METALFRGRVFHKRFAPKEHIFNYPIAMIYLDLSELDQAFEGSSLWSARRPALAWIRRRDYFGEPRVPLEQCVRTLVEDRTGYRPTGAIRLLTFPRTLGLRMNPVSLYYCFAPGGELEALVAEVTNTPWGERHCYVVHREQAKILKSWKLDLEKVFHVSPFLPMSMAYRWRFTEPGQSITFHMENLQGDETIFQATLALKRVEATPKTLRRVLLSYPLMTWRVFFWIYLQAGKLKAKGIPFFPHPKKREGGSPPSDPGTLTSPELAEGP